MDIFQQNVIEQHVEYIFQRYRVQGAEVSNYDLQLAECVDILLKIAIEQETKIDELQTKLKRLDRIVWDHLH